MTDRKAIEARIAELREELGRAEGTPTEVYSRIVGYYRSVRNWNAGKREEYGMRLAFGMPDGDSLRRLSAETEGGAGDSKPAEPSRRAAESAPAAMAEPEAASLRDGILVFTRETCPNCSPVANYVVASGMKAVFVDVDADEGLALARDYGIMATPTVLALDGEGRESFRAFDVAGLRSRFAPAGAL
jgi:ribonucleoside-triphosphate reductase